MLGQTRKVSERHSIWRQSPTVTWNQEFLLPSVTQMRYKLQPFTNRGAFHIKPSTNRVLAVTTDQMFVDSVEVINSHLENITLNVQNNMHPKSNRPPACPTNRVPHLNITPSSTNQKKNDGSPQQSSDNPWLLKPQHEIPATPPPQVNAQPSDYFSKRIG